METQIASKFVFSRSLLPDSLPFPIFFYLLHVFFFLFGFSFFLSISSNLSGCVPLYHFVRICAKRENKMFYDGVVHEACLNANSIIFGRFSTKMCSFLSAPVHIFVFFGVG